MSLVVDSSLKRLKETLRVWNETRNTRFEKLKKILEMLKKKCFFWNF